MTKITLLEFGCLSENLEMKKQENNLMNLSCKNQIFYPESIIWLKDGKNAKK